MTEPNPIVKAAKLLDSAADRFEADPGLWSRGALARNDQGCQCHPESLYAESFCATGMLRRIAHETDTRLEEVSLLALQQAVQNEGNYLSVPFWNDKPERTVPEVVAMLREASRLITPTTTGESQ